MSGASRGLSHVDETGGVRMVDVGAKDVSRRRAVAEAVLSMRPETAAILRELPKGDALATAQLAGIMAAKRTAELIPLCHQLPLSVVDVSLEVGTDHVTIVASAETAARTGVEQDDGAARAAEEVGGAESGNAAADHADVGSQVLPESRLIGADIGLFPERSAELALPRHVASSCRGESGPPERGGLRRPNGDVTASAQTDFIG